MTPRFLLIPRVISLDQDCIPIFYCNNKLKKHLIVLRLTSLRVSISFNLNCLIDKLRAVQIVVWHFSIEFDSISYNNKKYRQIWFIPLCVQILKPAILKWRNVSSILQSTKTIFLKNQWNMKNAKTIKLMNYFSKKYIVLC